MTWGACSWRTSPATPEVDGGLLLPLHVALEVFEEIFQLIARWTLGEKFIKLSRSHSPYSITDSPCCHSLYQNPLLPYSIPSSCFHSLYTIPHSPRLPYSYTPHHMFQFPHSHSPVFHTLYLPPHSIPPCSAWSGRAPVTYPQTRNRSDTCHSCDTAGTGTCARENGNVSMAECELKHGRMRIEV